MSIKVMSQVWEHSQHKGGELLLLLAIADHADDQGTAYPSIGRLAKKTRMTDRNVQLVLRRLTASPELTIHLGAGPHGCHLFEVTIAAACLCQQRGEDFSGGENFSPEKLSGVKNLRGEKSGKILHKISPKPSLDPSEEREEELSSTILSGTETGGFLPEAPNEHLSTAHTTKTTKKTLTPLAPDDWLWQELQHYRDEFDVDALNDDTWWLNLGNSFPAFDRKWVPLAFASLASWLQDNVPRRPRSARGWKQRMRFSLNWYYDKHMRREAYGKATTTKTRY